MARVLIIQTGSTHPDVIARHGDYDDWFAAALRANGAEPTIVRPFRGEALPEASGWDGILLTGSPLSVRDEAPWMAALAAWSLAAAAKTPVLAVCFGHQLLGEALGGRVEANPAGGEYGTIEVSLSAAGASDPLFAGLPTVLCVQSTHRDALVVEPRGVVLLGGTANTPWQSFAWGPNLRAVQFHPEFSDVALRDLLVARGIPGQTQPSDHGQILLANWLRHWVKPAPHTADVGAARAEPPKVG